MTMPEGEEVDEKDVYIGTTNEEGFKDENIVPVEPPEEDSTSADSTKLVFEKVEVEASFPGGQSEWGKFLGENLNMDTIISSGAPPGIYTVVIQFTVGKDGSIADIKPLTNIGYNAETEAIRVIRKSPNWVAGIQNGRKVNSFRRQPITFKLEEEKTD
jgi:periplasmic protein TonB